MREVGLIVGKRTGLEEPGEFVADGVDGLMIEAAGVQKVYEAGGLRVRALRGVDLGIRRGRWSQSWGLRVAGRRPS